MRVKSLLSHFDQMPRLDVLLGFLICVLIAGQFVFDTRLHRLFMYLSFPVGLYFLWHGGRAYLSRLRSRRLFQSVCLFLAWALLSTFWSDIQGADDAWRASKIAVFVTLSLLIVVAYFHKYPNGWVLFINIYVLSALVTGVALFITTFDLFWMTYVQGIPEEGERLWRLDGFGRARNSNLAGVLYSLAVFAALLAPAHKVFAHFDRLSVRVILASFLFFILFLTLSRGALLAFIITGGLFLFLQACRVPKYRKVAFFMPVVGCVAVALVAAFAPSVVTYIIERGATGRLEIWRQAIAHIQNAPVIGHGIGTRFEYDFLFYGVPTQVNHTHNIYLGTLVHMGLFGLLLLLPVWFFALLKAFKYGCERDDFMPLISIVYGGVFGLFDYAGLYASLGTEWMIFWFPIMVVLAYDLRRTRDDNNKKAVESAAMV